MHIEMWRRIFIGIGFAAAGAGALAQQEGSKPQPPPPQEKPAAPPETKPDAKPRPDRRQRPPRPELPNIEEFKLKSAGVSAVLGEEFFIEAGVVKPLDWKEGEKLPVCYNIHGFGGSHEAAWYSGARLQQQEQAGSMPRMLYVFLNAQCPRGHHEFADSANNGPCGQALTTEFIPALEKEFDAVGEPWARFVTGHSSGGWSSLWLQVTYPDFFGGCWSTAPDSVDFRDFTGIDIYSFDNAYVDPDGKPIMLMRRNGQFVSSIKDYVEGSDEANKIGGQFYSFNAVFSEKAADGTPKMLFDWRTGAIDAAVADSWRKYDISLILQENWKTLAPKLAGKVHIYMGLIDTFRLEGPLILMKEELEKVASDVEILLVEGRDHGSLFQPHPELWPKGMMERIHREMFETWQKNAAAHAR